MHLSLSQIARSRTMWSVVGLIAVQIINNVHPSNPEVAQALTYIGLALTAYFRARPKQIGATSAAGTLSILPADSEEDESVPASTNLATFGAPPAGQSAVADLARGDKR